MKTLLELERYQRGRLLEQRTQRSRSFVKGLFDLLYLAHSQLPAASPLNVLDVIGQARDIDGDSDIDGARSYKGILQVVAPSGDGAILVPMGGAWEKVNPDGLVAQPHHFMRGENIGIEVGVGTTAVTPDDRQIEEKVFHGQNSSVGVNSKFDYYDEPSNHEWTIDSANDYVAALIMPIRGFKLNSVKLLLYRAGNPGNIELNIRGVRANDMSDDWYPETPSITSVVTDGNTLPTASPYEWREFTLAAPIIMNPGFIYMFDIHAAGASGGNEVHWRDVEYGVGNEWGRYCIDMTTGGLGGTWYNQGDHVPCFELWGTAQAEFEYSGCEIFGYTVADPNAEFKIRRLFTNNSGESITVNEVGIYAMATRKKTCDYDYMATRHIGSVHPICIARDIVSPAIAVADGEVLAVTYTPQITV